MSFRISSSAFKNNDYIPFWYSKPGGNSSPPIGWTEPPKGTLSLTLIVSCLDPSSNKEYCHWVMYNIPPRKGTIQGKQSHNDVVFEGALQGVNSFGSLGWDGQDESNSDQVMNFTLYALDIKLDLPPAASRDDVEAEMNGHVLEQTKLSGLC